MYGKSQKLLECQPGVKSHKKINTNGMSSDTSIAITATSAISKYVKNIRAR